MSDTEDYYESVSQSQSASGEVFSGAAKVGLFMAKVGVAVGALSLLIFSGLGVAMFFSGAHTKATATIVSLAKDSMVVSFAAAAPGAAGTVTTVKATLSGSPGKAAKVGDTFPLWYNPKEPTKSVRVVNPAILGSFAIAAGLSSLLWSLFVLWVAKKSPFLAAAGGLGVAVSIALGAARVL